MVEPSGISDIGERYARTQERVARALRERPSHFNHPVTLIAVSKTQPVEAIEALYRLGHRDFGENYVQELAGKAEALQARGCEGIRWHMVGHLQSNKVKALLPHVTVLHSLGSEKLAAEIDKRWKASGRSGKLPIFVEVNIDQQESKSGLLPDAVAPLLNRLNAFSSLEAQGLMGIPDPETSSIKEAFQRLRKLSETTRTSHHGLLSMGMTQDFEVALHEGATHIRIGTAIFGPRPASP